MLLKDYLYPSNYLMGASDYLAHLMYITQEDQLSNARVRAASTSPIKTYHWSEPESESGYEKHSTYGHLVSIGANDLIDILKLQNQAMIFEVFISFEDDSYNFYGTPSKPVAEKRLFSLEVSRDSNALLWKQLLYCESTESLKC